MELRVAFLPRLAGDVDHAICVVIDALRATTVIPTLFERGCPRVYVAASHDTARAWAGSHDCLLCGETDGLKPEGFDLGNSPVELSTLDLSARPAVLSTTNGTKAAVAVALARGVIFGAARNRTAAATAARQWAAETSSDIVVVCAGTGGAFTIEDATVAGLYVEAIVGQSGPWDMPALDDAALAARRLWQTEPNLLRGWMEGRHARRLADLGFGDDIGYSAQIDCSQVVPVMVPEAAAASVEAPVVLVQEA